MRLLSWNVRGLGGPRYLRTRGVLRQELQRCLVGGPIDMLLLQEHHLSESRIRRCGQLMHRQSETFWSAAFGTAGAQGGVCICIAESWRDAIVDRGIVVPGRAQWVIMQRGEVRFGILNLYAPNQSSARASFWDQLVDALPTVEHWCIGGDFNMIEVPSDRVGGSHTTLQGSELAAWERLCLTLRIDDVWHHAGFGRERDSLLFSRSDHRVGGANLSRIDRFYASDWFRTRGGSTGILAGTTLSDHAPVILVIADEMRSTSSSVRIPEHVLLDRHLSERVEAMWAAGPWLPFGAADSFAGVLLGLSSAFRDESQRRLEEARETARRLRRSVAALQRQQEMHPDSAWVETQLMQARQELRETEERRHEFSYHRQAAHWTQVGDRVTGDFFDTTGPRHARTGVRRLRRPDGSCATAPEEIRGIATDFYRILLSAEEPSTYSEECRQTVWLHTRRVVTAEMRMSLMTPFSEGELLDALRALPRDSCPGEDGLLPSFFMRYWEIIGPTMRLAFQEVMDTGHLPESLSEGLIYLIPKEGGNPEEVRQWRPITILNSAYKILAKALSLRLQPLLETLIHPTQTGFVKGRSILDNIFTFWEAVSIARLREEDMAILLLDFEKAYDRVDWGFLEGTMLRMGFPEIWIRGVSALYSSAHSQVLMAGGRGERFALTRSVRQGCPLAPTLFLFFAEAMSSFLASQEVGLQGLRLPIREETVLDAEFADDTAMYLRGHEANLRRFEGALEIFCAASGAQINWHKSCGFWTGRGSPPQWLPSPQFRWIPSGTPVRYLGCQIGIDLTAEQQIAPLLLSIRKKLLHWSSAHLTFAGRVVVSNQVLLATMWYITSCWIFSSSCISQVQRLIRNFLWSGGDGRPARAKVSWSVISLPTACGGLGIVDPACQSRALLGKLIVRGLMPGEEPWKELLLYRIQRCTPTTGGPWQPETRWIFTEMRRVGITRRCEDRFACCILRTWEMLRPALVQVPPCCSEERLRQPLVWNPQIRTDRGHMVGTRQHVSWGALEMGPARRLGEWLEFRQLPEEVQATRLTGMRGSAYMIADIETAIPAEWLQPMDSPAPIWMGAFSRLDILITVRGCAGDRVLFFEVEDGGRLHRVRQETPLVAHCTFQRIRVIGCRDRAWHIDPDPEEIVGDPSWRLWAWERRPLERLQWDPGEWQWRDPFASSGSPDIPFFQYTARLGRHILTARQGATPAAAEHWRRQGLTTVFLTDFWMRLWESRQARRSVTFLWLVAHRGTAVGVWLAYGGHSPACSRCGYAQESQRHCLWDCPLAQQIWRRILRLFAGTTEAQTFTWGAAAWITRSGPALRYETEISSQAIIARGGRTFTGPVPDLATHPWTTERDRRWELIGSLAVWFIWRSRCRQVFEGIAVPPAETIRDFWLELIHTLRGQYERLQGSSDSMERARFAFLQLWGKEPFYIQRSRRWQYQPPVWLYPPPID